MPLVTTVPLRMSTKVSGRTRVWKNSRVFWTCCFLFLRKKLIAFLGQMNHGAIQMPPSIRRA